MKNLNIYKKVMLIMSIVLFATEIFAQDPNFHIYLCFGQSNMEGQGAIEYQDRTVDSRFQVIEAVDCSNLGRTKGNWYTATPPLCRCYTGLSPADYFGRTLVQNLPSNIKVGVVHVAVAGCKIELFDKDTYQSYVASVTEDWLKNIINSYGGNPYGYMVDLAKKAQQVGVIKGFLLHQGESNVGDYQWPNKVRSIYYDLINDLGLNANEVPLLAGEVVNADQGGICASVNTIIAQLPQVLPNSYVISSSGCTAGPDNLHFDSEGYRELGRRYGEKMLTLLNNNSGNTSVWLEAECGTVGSLWNTITDGNASNDKYVTIQSGLNSTSSAPTSSNDQISYNFNVGESGTYNVWARVITPNGNDDSFWFSMDGSSWFLWNNIGPNSNWNWEMCQSYNLSAGSHTLKVAYREDGALLDKILVSNTGIAPSGEGNVATNCSSNTDYAITVRARGISGSEQIRLSVGGNAVQTWMLGTSMNNYTATTSLSGNIRVEFINDDGTVRDVQVDYIQANGILMQAENQAVNTSVWQNSTCGGSYSEWMHCGGYIEFSSVKSPSSFVNESILSPTDSDEISVYPNPVEDQITISFSSSDDIEANLYLYNSTGNLVKTSLLSHLNNPVNLVGLPSGIYFVKIDYHNQIITKKFIIK